MKFGLGIWRPDYPDYVAGRRNNLQVVECDNFLRQAGKWTPLNRAFVREGAVALPADPVRSWQFKLSDGNSYVFIEAQDGHIYRKNSSAWDQVSTVATVTRWDLEQWGNRVYAVTSGQLLQKWTAPATLADPTPQFVDIADGPMGAMLIRRFADFLIVANFGSDGPAKIQWSGLQTPDVWTPALNFSGSQVLDQGEITDLIAFEDLYVVCANAVERCIVIGGTFVFQFSTINRHYGAEKIGLSIGIDRFLWVGSTAGFIKMDPQGTVEPIGDGQVDDTFRSLLDEQGSHGIFVYYDEVRKAVRWSFPSRQALHPDTTLVYSRQTRSWGKDNAPHPVLFVDKTLNLTWSEMASRWGRTVGEIFSTLRSFSDPRLVGVDILQGFDENNKAGSMAAFHERSGVTTCQFAPYQDGRRRALVTGVRPWTDGRPTVEIAAFERPQQGRQFAGRFEPGEAMLDTGLIPAYRSGRYFQIRFVFPNTESYSWLTGFDLEFEPDGEI